MAEVGRDSMERMGRLIEFVRSAYSLEELHAFLSTFEEGQEVLEYSKSHAETMRALDRRGFIDQDLFVKLVRHRPRRKAEVEDLARSHGFPLDEMPRTRLETLEAKLRELERQLDREMQRAEQAERAFAECKALQLNVLHRLEQAEREKHECAEQTAYEVTRREQEIRDLRAQQDRFQAALAHLVQVAGSQDSPGTGPATPPVATPLMERRGPSAPATATPARAEPPPAPSNPVASRRDRPPVAPVRLNPPVEALPSTVSRPGPRASGVPLLDPDASGDPGPDPASRAPDRSDSPRSGRRMAEVGMVLVAVAAAISLAAGLYSLIFGGA